MLPFHCIGFEKFNIPAKERADGVKTGWLMNYDPREATRMKQTKRANTMWKRVGGTVAVEEQSVHELVGIP